MTISTVFLHPYSISGETSKNQNINSESPKVPPQSTDTKRTIVINFSGNVSSESVALLMQNISVWMLSGYKDFLLLINSNGGDLDSSIAAYNYLSSLPVTIRTHNLSVVKSAAIYIYCAGSNRTASPNSIFLVHNGTANYSDGQTIGELNGTNQWYKLALISGHKIFSICAGITEKQSRNIFYSESVFSATEAKNVGFVNEVGNVKIDSNAIFSNYDAFKK